MELPAVTWASIRLVVLNPEFLTAAGTRADTRHGWNVPHFRDSRKVSSMGVGVMTKAVWSGIAAAAVVVLVSTSAFAQTTVNGAISVTANVNAKAKLTLGTAAISFADADPDVTPVMSATAFNIDVKARTSGAGNVTLTVVASNDLTSGSDIIAIGGLTWTVSGGGFQAGTSNKTTAQTVGSWTGSGNQTGSQTYSLPNSWTYATGTYTATLNYTLTVP